MRTSETRILTTHVGSLPRSPRLTELLLMQERGEAIDQAELAQQVETAVEAVVRKQLETGIDIGNDGEQPRVAFHTYVARRMRGFGGGWVRPVRRDVTEFPDFATMWCARQQSTARPRQTPQAWQRWSTPTCMTLRRNAISSCAPPRFSHSSLPNAL